MYSLLGTTYGGDGRTTFALPDLRGRVPIHVGTGPGLSTYQQGQRGGAEQVTVVETVANRVINELIAKKNATIEKIQSGIELSDVDVEENTYRESRVIILESEIDYMKILLQKAPVEVQRALAESILVSRMTPLQHEIREKRNLDTQVQLSEEEMRQRRKELWQLHEVRQELEREAKIAVVQ